MREVEAAGFSAGGGGERGYIGNTLHWGFTGNQYIILGLYGDHGKEHGNYYSGFRLERLQLQFWGLGFGFKG